MRPIEQERETRELREGRPPPAIERRPSRHDPDLVVVYVRGVARGAYRKSRQAPFTRYKPRERP